MAHVERIKQIARFLARLCIGFARQHRQQSNIVGHVKERDQIGCLEDEADQVSTQGAQVAYFPAIVVNHLLADAHSTRSWLDHCA